MATREENLKKVNADIKNFFSDKEIEISDEIFQQMNEKIEEMSDKELEKIALQNISVEFEKIFADEVLSDEELEQVAGGRLHRNINPDIDPNSPAGKFFSFLGDVILTKITLPLKTVEFISKIKEN